MRTIISVLSMIVIIVCLIWTSQLSGIDTREGLLVSIILAIASSVISWAISSFYSEKTLTAENTKLIDRIGEQSSEKILNQSKQLYSIEQYLDEKQNILLEKDLSPEGSIFLESTRNMIRLVRSSNNTYINDWTGVVSDKVKDSIIKQRNAQSQLFEDINLIRHVSPDKREKLEEKIEKASQDLPSYLVPVTTLKENHASIIEHIYIEDTTSIKKGRLKIYLAEDCYKGHVVGKFLSTFSNPPKKSTSSMEKAVSRDQQINTFARTGTVYDFHVGIKSIEYNIPLKKGIYEVEYCFEE
ncbi:hypothetical protein [Taibaiella sp. KBW10]|uniref:hypothetical protein n=1 Tax=Taibaiella sp. KBW10 TaxID=2153357 RepID=UPI000F5A8C1E|nr:hypothetical protein [Taibaiella sp. KBW10]